MNLWIRRSETRTRAERGAVLVLTSFTLVAMLSFAALAIDIGVVRAERAQYQAAADSAALYATYLIRQPGADVNVVAQQVRESVAQNLAVTNGASNAYWAGCDDPNPLPVVAAADTAISNDCISFDLSAVSTTRNARVRIPLRRIKPVIGLGAFTMDVTAVAGAQGSGGGCDAFAIGGCVTPTTAPATTVAPTTGPTTTRPATTIPGTTRPTTTRPTTTRPPTTVPGTTRPTTTRPTTTRPPTTVPGTTRPTSTVPPTTRPTTTLPPQPPTTLDIGF